MIDHIGIAVSDIDKSRKFYEAALGALGMKINMSVSDEKTESGGTALGFGRGDDKIFWIADGERPGEGNSCRFRGGQP